MVASVEAVIQGDDLIGAVAMDLPPLAGELDGALVRLRTAVGEERLIKSAQPGDLLGQRDHRLVIESRAAVDELCCLPRDRIDDRARTMAETIDRPALNEVEIALAGFVRQPAPLPFHEHDGWATGDVHQGIEGAHGGRLRLCMR
jgi:hypothetical protein